MIRYYYLEDRVDVEFSVLASEVHSILKLLKEAQTMMKGGKLKKRKKKKETGIAQREALT